MTRTIYLTQFICICDRCSVETMAIEINSEVRVECGGNECDNRRWFSRPQTTRFRSLTQFRPGQPVLVREV